MKALFHLLLQHNNPPQHYDGSSGDINSSVALAQHDQQWWESDPEGVALSALIVPEIPILENNAFSHTEGYLHSSPSVLSTILPTTYNPPVKDDDDTAEPNKLTEEIAASFCEPSYNF
jgi:hypothetical protein